MTNSPAEYYRVLPVPGLADHQHHVVFRLEYIDHEDPLIPVFYPTPATRQGLSFYYEDEIEPVTEEDYVLYRLTR